MVQPSNTDFTGVMVPNNEPTASIPPGVDVVETKAWWKSKTVWMNVIALAVAMLTPLTTSPLVSETIQHGIIYVVTVINIVLRGVGNQATLTVKGLPVKEYLRKA